MPLSIVLDTSHLSELARHSTSDEATKVFQILQADRARLGLSIMHFIELAAPGFKSSEEVRALLRDVPISYCMGFDDVFDEEVAIVCATVTSKHRPPPRVFTNSLVNWGKYAGRVDGAATDFLDAVRSDGETREGLLRFADQVTHESMIKAEAALIKNPDLPLQLLVQRHLDRFRSRDFDYANELSAREIISRAGGIRAFPAVETHQELIRQRLMLREQKSTRNDVFDEYIAVYAPYAAALTVDRRTYARFESEGYPRSIGLPDLWLMYRG